jgi:hypothetical protein
MKPDRHATRAGCCASCFSPLDARLTRRARMANSSLVPSRSTAVIADEIRREYQPPTPRSRRQSGTPFAAANCSPRPRPNSSTASGDHGCTPTSPGKPRTAQLYIRLARESATVAHLPTIGEAAALIASGTKRPRPARPETWEVAVEQDIAKAPRLTPEMRGYLRALGAVLDALAYANDVRDVEQMVASLKAGLVEGLAMPPE